MVQRLSRAWLSWNCSVVSITGNPWRSRYEIRRGRYPELQTAGFYWGTVLLRLLVAGGGVAVLTLVKVVSSYHDAAWAGVCASLIFTRAFAYKDLGTQLPGLQTPLDSTVEAREESGSLE